jgi:hypothetical protein
MTQEELAANFKLERYKYILGQLNSLNENLHKYLTLFQTLTTAIVSAGVAVFVSWQKLGITASMAQLSIRILLGLLVILAAFVILSVISGVFSWLDYRREEVKLLDKTVETGFRSLPNVKNFWRWYETYVVVFVLSVVIIALVFVERQVLPQIQ